MAKSVEQLQRAIDSHEQKAAELKKQLAAAKKAEKKARRDKETRVKVVIGAWFINAIGVDSLEQLDLENIREDFAKGKANDRFARYRLDEDEWQPTFNEWYEAFEELAKLTDDDVLKILKEESQAATSQSPEQCQQPQPQYYQG